MFLTSEDTLLTATYALLQAILRTLYIYSVWGQPLSRQALTPKHPR